MKLDKKQIKFLEEKSYLEIINSSKVDNLKEIKRKYLGKEGIISQFLHELKNPENVEKRKELGNLINLWKKSLSKKIEELEEEQKKKNIEQNLLNEKIDIAWEGKKLPLTYAHPINYTIQKIFTIFLPLGYQIVETPEIETDENNFSKLNMPLGHPARDMHDTFYFSSKLLLRTHTSGTQIHVLKKNPNQELKVITAGKVYRRDEDDVTHTHQFTQLEGFVVGKDISLADLKGTLELLLHQLFGSNHPLRFRPSYFPFTEPSLEVDAQCLHCQGKGCNICKKTGWVEVLGAGLIHPQVLKNCGYDSEIYSGFAFGAGIERLLMIQYGIEDIRHFYLNDWRFLQQFRLL